MGREDFWTRCISKSTILGDMMLQRGRARLDDEVRNNRWCLWVDDGVTTTPAGLWVKTVPGKHPFRVRLILIVDLSRVFTLGELLSKYKCCTAVLLLLLFFPRENKKTPTQWKLPVHYHSVKGNFMQGKFPLSKKRRDVWSLLDDNLCWAPSTRTKVRDIPTWHYRQVEREKHRYRIWYQHDMKVQYKLSVIVFSPTIKQSDAAWN